MTTRREALLGALAASTGAAAPLAIAAQQDEANKDSPDRQSILAAGMTEAEADCWQKTAEAAGAFFALPELHPMDQQEVATAIHVLQNKLLSRPTYRTYLAEAKRRAG